MSAQSQSMVFSISYSPITLSNTITPNLSKNLEAYSSSNSSILNDLVKPCSSMGRGSKGGTVCQSIINYSKILFLMSILVVYIGVLKSQSNQLVYIFPMKSTKSKGKAKVIKPSISKPIVQYKPNKNRRVKLPQVPKREITVSHLQKKAVLTISHIDSNLGRAMVMAFGSPNYRLTQSSLLTDLKPKGVHIERPFQHTLNTCEAVNLFTHLTRKRKGDANPMHQLEELESILKLYNLESKDLQEQLEEQRGQFNNEVNHLRRTIKGIYVQLRDKLKNNFHNSEDYFKSQLLEWKIKKMGVQLIDSMIIAIKEVDFDKVQVLYEQSYPERTVSKRHLIQILGESRYNAKKIDFVRKYRQARINERRNTNFIVCHICKQLITDTYLRCRNRQYNIIEPNVKNSPNFHEKHLLSVDYLYVKNEDPMTDEQLNEELDYFKYSQLGRRYVCNRFICPKCVEDSVYLANMQEISKYICQFCKATCLCRSCVLAQEIVKALALYKHILINNYQQMDKYRQLVKFVNLDHASTEVFLNPRNSFESHLSKQYQKYYFERIQEFNKINEVMDKFQKQAIRSVQLVSDATVSITDYMSQVRSFIISIRRERGNQPRSTNKKSLSLIREVKKGYQEFQQKRRQHDRLDDEMGKGMNSEKMKLIRLKLKLIGSGQQAIKTQRFQVPTEVVDVVKDEMFFFQDQLEQFAQNMTKMSDSLSKDQMKLYSMVKKVIPFEKIDYQLAANVKPQCRIIDETDLILRRAQEEEIIFHGNHRIYTFRGAKIDRFYQNAEEFADLLFKSDESDSESQDEIQDIQKSEIASASLSSFLERNLYRQDYVIADDIADVSQYESAGSSWVMIDQQQELKQQITTNQPLGDDQDEDEL